MPYLVVALVFLAAALLLVNGIVLPRLRHHESLLLNHSNFLYEHGERLYHVEWDVRVLRRAGGTPPTATDQAKSGDP